MHKLLEAADPLLDRDARYYQWLAGGVKMRLLEAFLDLRIPELLAERGQATASELCERLRLDSHRGWKFLHLLAMMGLVDKQGGDRGEDDAVFRLSPLAQAYFGADGRGGFYYRDLVTYWRNVAELPLLDVLRGLPLPRAVRWPPPGPEQAEHLETWMRLTAQGAIGTIADSGAMEGAATLLDVGGGDGTVGCALVQRYPRLLVTVFNLPASAAIARRTIDEAGCGQRVAVHEGDFLQDPLPRGFDRVLFSRVLTDWDAATCLMLFRKARESLASGGRLVINEALVDENPDFAMAWEFRYVFYDTFGRALFKPLRVYERLLAEAGFDVVRVLPPVGDELYSVVEAEPKAA